jgi:GNAT superfamily N-acetyltransferase
MKDILFRKGAGKDIERLTELRQRGLLEEGEEATSDITKGLLDFYKTHLADGSFVAWVAVADHKIVGTSGISFVEKPPYYGNPTGRIGLLSNMYTVQEYRRQGIAKKLLSLIVKEAKDRGCGVIHLTASAMGALLYQDFGFERADRFFQYKLE